MKLYEIAREWERLMERSELMSQEDLQSELDKLGAEAEVKLTNCWRLIRNLEAEEEALGAEAKRFADRKKTTANRVASLKNYVAFCLGAGNGWQSDDGVCKFAWKKCPASVDIVNEEVIPLDYVRTIYQPDKVAIKEALQKGEQVDGCLLVEDKMSLQVK